MTMPYYHATEIAGYVLDFYKTTFNFGGKDICSSISNLKLQSVLYFLQANHLVETKEPLFSDDIEAMSFGIYIDSVWRKYAVYGSSNIIIGDEEKEAKLKIYKKDRILMDEMLRTLKTYSAVGLFQIIRRQTPWSKAYHSKSYENQKKVIKPKELYDFFVEMNMSIFSNFLDINTTDCI